MTTDVNKPFGRAILAVVAASVLGLAVAQDSYDWLPSGGSDLIVQIASECEPCDDLATMLTTERTQEEWQVYFEESGAAERLSEAELGTVSGYLALEAPVGEGDVPEGNDVDPGSLPIDGRLATLQQCMICHGLARPITQTWPYDQWVSHFEGPTHSTIGMDEVQMQKIANYLANNTVPAEELPDDIRGDAPGY